MFIYAIIFTITNILWSLIYLLSTLESICYLIVVKAFIISEPSIGHELWVAVGHHGNGWEQEMGESNKQKTFIVVFHALKN